MFPCFPQAYHNPLDICNRPPPSSDFSHRYSRRICLTPYSDLCLLKGKPRRPHQSSVNAFWLALRLVERESQEKDRHSVKRLLFVVILLSLLLVPDPLRGQSGNVPAAPSLTAIQKQKSVEISWDAVPGAVGYHLWVWTVADSWQQLDDGNLTDTHFNQSGLEAGVRYYYTFRAVFSSDNTGIWSDYASVTTAQAVGVPVLSAAIDGDLVSLSWTEVSEAIRYQLWVWDRANNWQLLDDNLLVRTFRHASIEAGATYFFTARAQDSSESNSAWPDYASLDSPSDIVTETAMATPIATATFTRTPTPTLTATAAGTPTPTAAADASSTYLQGITIAPENRCSTYDSDDYPYSQSVEQQIVAALDGRIYSPYTGEYFENTRETDIEHIVARSEAHDSGLCSADMQTRKGFSRDLANLTLASPSVNRHQKGAKDLADWLPEQNRCWYVNQVVVVKRKYSLTMDSGEAQKAVEILRGCTTVNMIFLSGPPPTATPTATSDGQNNALDLYDDNGNGRITCAEARKHGIAPVHRGHPAYQYMDDRDNDGEVCE